MAFQTVDAVLSLYKESTCIKKDDIHKYTKCMQNLIATKIKKTLNIYSLDLTQRTTLIHCCSEKVYTSSFMGKNI